MNLFLSLISIGFLDRINWLVVDLVRRVFSWLRSTRLLLLSLQECQSISLGIWIWQDLVSSYSTWKSWARIIYSSGCTSWLIDVVLFKFFVLDLASPRTVWTGVLLNAAQGSSISLSFLSLFGLTLFPFICCICWAAAIVAAFIITLFSVASRLSISNGSNLLFPAWTVSYQSLSSLRCDYTLVILCYFFKFLLIFWQRLVVVRGFIGYKHAFRQVICPSRLWSWELKLLLLALILWTLWLHFWPDLLLDLWLLRLANDI